MIISPGKYWGMRRLANRHGLYCMTALDQRPPIMNPIKAKLGTAHAPDSDVAAVKRVIAKELAPLSSALLVDPTWAYSACIDCLNPSQGLVLTLEDHRFEDLPGGRKSRSIPDWSVEKIKRLGGDGVKVLAWYRPDASDEVIEHQKSYVRAVGDACRRFDIPFVFELLVYPLMTEGHDYLEDQDKRPDMVIESVRTFAADEYGVDVFKLESPIPAKDVPPFGAEAGPSRTQELFDALGEAAGRPWVMLSAGAGKAEFKNVLQYAFKAGASGFLAGRAIWADSFALWPDLDGMATDLRQNGAIYLKELTELASACATPLQGCANFAAGVTLEGRGFELPSRYAGMHLPE